MSETEKTTHTAAEPVDAEQPAKSKHKVGYVDNGWPKAVAVADGEHAVSEFAAPLVGAMSPFGDVTFPQEHIPYVHPHTRVNR